MHNRYASLKSSALVLALGFASALTATAETIAYYRFETGAPGQPFGRSTDRAIIDSSERGNHAFPKGAPVCMEDIAARVIPFTGEANTHSIHFTGQDYLNGAPDDALSRFVFTDFTIELWARFDSLRGWQTLVGRDDTGSPGEGVGPNALFYLSKAGDRGIPADQTRNGFRVELVTHNNQILAFNSSFKVATEKWYHIAVVGDVGVGTLTLFVDGAEVGGTTGYTGMFVPTTQTPWSIGRGQYEGKNLDFFLGCMDEVRFSNRALTPSQFLNAHEVRPPSRP